MGFKRSFSVIAAAVLAVTGVAPASATPAWAPDVEAIQASGYQPDYTQGNNLLFVQEEGGNGGTVVVSQIGGDGLRAICEDIGPNLDCGTGEEVNVGGQATLPICTGVVENCIESLEVAGADGTYLRAAYRGTTNGTKFRGAPRLGIPSGTGPAIFDSEIRNSETSEYTVEATLSFWYSAGRPGDNRSFSPSELSLRVQPTKATVKPGTIPAIAEIQDLTADGKENSIGVSGDQNCVYQDTDLCGVALNFAPSTSFRVSLVLTNKLAGWFRGRIQDPTISVDAVDSQYSRVTIGGSPVEIPRFLATHSLSKGDPDIVGPMNENAHGGVFTLFSAASERAMEIVNGMRERVSDTAAGVSTVWSMNSISGQRAAANSPEAQRCLQSGSQVLGIVTTNAMTYTGTIPEFNNGFLSYKVAGLHYQPDGQTLNLGTYDLVMRSETARCLYGFTRAPVSATVAVIGEQGDETVATTVVSERDGWLKLAAYGFTFSEKEIQVKITQPQMRTLSDHPGRATALTSKQKAEIRAVLARSKGNTKFICTGIRLEGQSQAMNRIVRLRAKLACDYAKSLNPQLSTFFQSKVTKARSFNGRVLVVSR
jgi:hypothetical protein